MPLENHSINLDALVGNLGEKTQDPDVKKDIVTRTMYNPKLENRIQVVEGVIDEIPIVNANFSDPLAPLPDANTVNFKEDVVAFDNRILKTRQIVLAVLLTPRNLLQNYLALINRENYKNKANQGDPFYLPFEEFLMNKLVEAAQEAMYLKGLFKGVYNAAGTSSSDLFDGYLKKAADAITAGDLTPVATGAITSTNVIPKLQMVYDALGDEVKGQGINLHVSSQIFDWLQRSYSSMANRSIVISDVSQAAMAQPLMSIPLDGTNAIVHREPGMGTSQRVIATVAGNAHLGFYGNPNDMQFEIQKFNLQLKVIMTFKAGAEFATLKDSFHNIAVNNQA